MLAGHVRTGAAAGVPALQTEITIDAYMLV